MQEKNEDLVEVVGMKIIVIVIAAAAAAAYEREALEVSNKCWFGFVCVKLGSLARETCNVTTL